MRQDSVSTSLFFWKFQSCAQCDENTKFMLLLFAMEPSTSIGAWLASIMFFGCSDGPVPLVDHVYILDALFHFRRSPLAAVGWN